jgi:hypothetical protein
MSLVSDWAEWVDNNVIEKGKAVLGEAIEYAAPENTKRRTALNKIGEVQRTIGAGLSTAALLTDQNNPEFKDGFQLSDIASTYRGPAQKISPTQALFGASDLAPFNLPRKAFNLAESLGVNVPTGGRKDFNIYDDAQRRKAFDEEIIGKWTTGLGDFAVSWYADPFIVGAEVGALAKGKFISPKAPIGDLEGIKKITSTKGASSFIDYALQSDAAGLYKHPIAQMSNNPELISGVFGDINIENYGAKARPIAEDSFRAMLGDEQALGRLQKEAASIADIIDRTKSTKLAKQDLQYIADLRYNGDVNEMLLKDKELGIKTVDIIEDIKKRSTSFRAIMNRVNDASLESPFIGDKAIMPSRFSFVEKARGEISNARAKAFLNETSRLKTGNLNRIDGLEWSTKTIKQSVYDHAIRVISWSGLQKPSGWLEHKGINSSGSADELIAFMDQVKPLKTNKGAFQKRKLINQYLSAQSDFDRIAVALRIENSMVKAINKKYGLNRKLSQSERQWAELEGVKNPTTISDVIKWKIDQRRANVLNHYRKTGFAYNEGEWIITDPVLSSQLGEAVPLLDIKLYETFARRDLDFLRDATLGIKDGMQRAYFAFDSVWRPATLLRFGYPQRNVAEGSIRTALYQQSIMGITMALAKGSKNLSNNLYHSIVGNRIEKYNIAQELGIKAPKATLNSWNSIVKWQKNELVILRDKQKQLSNNLLNEQNKLRKKDIRSNEKTKIKDRIQRINEDLDDLNQNLNKQELLYSDMLVKIDTATKKRGGKYNKIRQGQENIVIDNLQFRGSKSGAIGSMGMKLSSSLQRQTKEIRNPLMQGSQYRTYGWDMVEPTNPNYFPSLYVVGRQLRQAEVTRRMLLIDTNLGARHIRSELNKIKQWFVSSDRVAKKEFRNTNVELATKENKKSPINVDNYIADRWNEVQTYFPDQSVRYDIATKPYEQMPSAYELEARMGQLGEQLSPVYGEIIGRPLDRNWRDIAKDYTNTAFKFLASMPEDALVRHPFYDSVYKTAIERGGQALIDKQKRTGKATSAEEIAGVEKAAHREALKETNRVLYTVKRYSNFAAYTSFMSPFIQAALNTTRVYSKLIFENPKPLIRPTQVWQDPYNKELIENDPETGEPLLTVQIPKSWKKYPGFSEFDSFKFPLSRLAIPFSGDPWWSAGFGPIVQVGVSNLVRAVPYLDAKIQRATGLDLPIKRLFIDKYVLPNGSSKEFGSLDLTLPANIKRVVSLARGVDDNAYLSSMQKITAVENQKYKLGLRTTEPTPEELVQRTSWLFALRFGINSTFGVIPQYGTQFDEFFNKYRELQNKYGFEQADAMFYEKYPEYFEMVVTTFRQNTTGVEASTVASDQSVKHRYLISKIVGDPNQDPFVTQLITNSWGAETKFDQSAYVFQLLNKPGMTGDVTYRNDIPVETALINAKVKVGWAEYNKFASWLDSEREKEGFVSINSRGATWLKEAKKQFVEDQKAVNPDWYNTYKEGFKLGKYKTTLRTIDTMLEDEEFTNSDWFKNEPAFQWLVEYMDFRDYISNELENSKSSDINSTSNQVLRDTVDNFVADAKRNSPKFALWYDRFLEQDEFGVYK